MGKYIPAVAEALEARDACNETFAAIAEHLGEPQAVFAKVTPEGKIDIVDRTGLRLRGPYTVEDALERANRVWLRLNIAKHGIGGQA